MVVNKQCQIYTQNVANLRVCELIALFYCFADFIYAVVVVKVHSFTLARFRRQKRSNVQSQQCSDLWSKTHTEVTFKRSSFLFVNAANSCDRLNQEKNLHGEFFCPQTKLLFTQIPNWNDWISSEKFCWPTVNVTNSFFWLCKDVLLFIVIGLWSCLLAKFKKKRKIDVWSYPLTHVHALPAVSAGVQESFPQPCWCSCTPASSLVFLRIRIGRKNEGKHRFVKSMHD